MYLMHYGVPGMKWGVRKAPTVIGRRQRSRTKEESSYRKKKSSTVKKVAIGAAIVGGTALAAYGGYKAFNLFRDKRAKKAIALGADSLKKMGFADAKPSIANKTNNVVVSLSTKTAPATPKPSIPKTEPKKSSYSPKLTLDTSKVSTGEDYLSQILKNQQKMSSVVEQVKDMSEVYGSLDDLTYSLLNRH